MGIWNRLVSSALRKAYLAKAKKSPPIGLEQIQTDRVERILLVSSTAIGDTLLSTPAIRALKKGFPNRFLGLVCHTRNRELVEHNPYLDKIHTCRSKFFGMRNLVRELRDTGYQLGVVLHGNDPESLPMCYEAGIRTIIGSDQSRFRFLTSDPVSVGDPFRHAIERRLDYVRLLGVEADGVHMDLMVSEEDERIGCEILHSRLKGPSGPLVAFHPAGSGSYKWWPAERFAELGRRLEREFGASILVLTGRKEADFGNRIVEGCGGAALNTAGEYGLAHVAAMLKRCALMVTTDSGPMHMALAMKVPTLAIIGADHPSRIGPYGVENARVLYRGSEVCREPRCLRGKCRDNVCMKAIEVEDVWACLTERFKRFMIFSRVFC